MLDICTLYFQDGNETFPLMGALFKKHGEPSYKMNFKDFCDNIRKCFISSNSYAAARSALVNFVKLEMSFILLHNTFLILTLSHAVNGTTYGAKPEVGAKLVRIV